MSLPREGARTTRDGIVVSTAMDWCRSPQAIVPYRIHTQGQIEGACTVASVRQNDEPSYVSSSLIKACYGDEAGTGGGVLSGTHGGTCEPKTYSSTVRIEDKGVVSHSDELWMNNKNTFGKLTHLRDINSYPALRRVKVAPTLRLAQAGAGTMTDAVPIGGEAISIPKPGLAAGAVVGGIALHELDVLREDRAIQNAAQQLDLNLQNTNDVLAARAYVWAKNMAPMSYWDVPWSGPRNESVARSVAKMERTHPGTVGAAGQGDPDAKKRLETAIAAGLATAGALQTIRITRSSKRNNCRRTVVISRSRSPLAAKHIEVAQASGQPRELTLDRPGTNQRRAANMRRSGLPPISLYDRDEYPPATFVESTNASVKYVPLSDNRSAGQQLKAQMNTPTRADEGCKVTITTGP